MKAIGVLKYISKNTPAEIYYAGACARDIVRRQKPDKLEVVVLNLPFQKILDHLEKHFNKIHVSRNKGLLRFIDNHSEVIVSLPCKNKKHSPYYTLRDDSRLRLFTIDAMYLPIISKDKRELVDFYHGRNSIRDRKIRTIGKADNAIKKNPAILIKAIALAAKLNYRIENSLFYAIKTNFELINKVRIKEIRDNFTQIILSSKPSRYLKIMHDTNLLGELIPELDMCYGMQQNKKYHKYDVFTHCLVACDSAYPNIVLKLAALFHDIGKATTYKEIVLEDGSIKGTFYNHEVAGAKIVKRILRRFQYDKEIISAVSNLVYNHMYNYEPESWSDTAVRRFIKKTHMTDNDIKDLDNFPLFLLRKADRAANGLGLSSISYRQKSFQERIKYIYDKSEVLHITDLDIDGNDIMNYFKLEQGPTVGHILNYLLGLVIENQSLNTKENLLKEASKYLSTALK